MPPLRSLAALAILLLPLLSPLGASPPAAEAVAGPWWSPAEARRLSRHARSVDRIPSARSLAELHELLASEPHAAGTPGDARVIEAIATWFEDLGLEVEVQELQVYLPRPVEGSVEILAPGPLALPVRERPLEEDPYTRRAGLPIGWNAFSGSGAAEGKVVYANYGRKEDFERLAELGVDLGGKIAVARYGGNFRGYKALFAERAGAAGLVLYTDPRDSGWERGLPFPEGGWANGTSIQRGSLLTLPYRGDPLTPFVPATPGAERLDPDDVAFHAIPVQPVGWEAAREILSRMRGPEVPDGWQGGLPFRYRLEGGPELRVRLEVRQERRLVETANVTGTLRGKLHPEQLVVFGSHHDAWIYGAGDPTAGTILVLEAARSFAEAARRGRRPDRSLVFAAWGAEEHGIVGSVEWVEAHRARLDRGGVAYLNADMAAMGPRFRMSSGPYLQRVLTLAAEATPDPYATEDTSLLESWLARTSRNGSPAFGDLGGGSDHVGFLSHLAVPSAALGAGGAEGVSYHTLYDDLHWYRKVVGEDYRSALMLTRAANQALVRLAGGRIPPLDPVAPARELRRHLEPLREAAAQAGMDLEGELERLEAASRLHEPLARRVMDRLESLLDEEGLEAATAEAVGRAFLRLPRCWRHEPGLPGRPWHRNLFAAPDETSGYAPWMLPALRKAVEEEDPKAFREAAALYRRAFECSSDLLAPLDELLRQAEEPGGNAG